MISARLYGSELALDQSGDSERVGMHGERNDDDENPCFGASQKKGGL
jgi:hypothetical protein